MKENLVPDNKYIYYNISPTRAKVNKVSILKGSGTNNSGQSLLATVWKISLKALYLASLLTWVAIRSSIFSVLSCPWVLKDVPVEAQCVEGVEGDILDTELLVIKSGEHHPQGRQVLGFKQWREGNRV